MSNYEEKIMREVSCDDCGRVLDLESDLESAEKDRDDLIEEINELKDVLSRAYDDLDKVMDTMKAIMQNLDV